MTVFFRRYPYWLLCGISIFAVAMYWLTIASDRYVSQANVVLESPQVAPAALSFSSILSGSSPDSRDMLLLKEHLESVDMLRRIDAVLDLRGHYASEALDWFSRLRSPRVPMEDFHAYYLDQVSVELDDYANVLRVRVSAFSPQMALAINQYLLKAGEEKMNLMGQRLAAEQVRFLEQQVDKLAVSFERAREDLLEFQNRNGLISPMGAVESISAVVAGLEEQLASLRSRRAALSSYQSKRSPGIVRLDSEIQAVSEQISKEQARLAQQSGEALNVTSSQYQSLELKASFSRESYSLALAALENTRIEAARKLKQVTVLQSPTLPEYAEEPRRIYNAVSYGLVVLFLTLILHMLVIVIKDHRD